MEVILEDIKVWISLQSNYMERSPTVSRRPLLTHTEPFFMFLVYSLSRLSEPSQSCLTVLLGCLFNGQDFIRIRKEVFIKISEPFLTEQWMWWERRFEEKSKSLFPFPLLYIVSTPLSTHTGSREPKGVCRSLFPRSPFWSLGPKWMQHFHPSSFSPPGILIFITCNFVMRTGDRNSEYCCLIRHLLLESDVIHTPASPQLSSMVLGKLPKFWVVVSSSVRVKMRYYIESSQHSV